MLAHDYEIGTTLRMGPGYFPALLGVALTLLGVASLLLGLRTKIPDPIPQHKLEPLILIFLGILAFSVLIERAGLLAAAAALIGLACFRRLLTHPLEVLGIYVVLTGLVALAFVYAFGIAIPVFWWDR